MTAFSDLLIPLAGNQISAETFGQVVRQDLYHLFERQTIVATLGGSTTATLGALVTIASATPLTVNLAAPSATGPIGVCLEGALAGEQCHVQFGGMVWLNLEGTQVIAPGDYLKLDTTAGQVVKATGLADSAIAVALSPQNLTAGGQVWALMLSIGASTGGGGGGGGGGVTGSGLVYTAPPAAASWTLFNATGLVVTDGVGGLNLKMPSEGLNIRGVVLTPPAAPWDRYLVCTIPGLVSLHAMAGFLLTDGTQCDLFCVHCTGIGPPPSFQIEAHHYTSVTGDAGGPAFMTLPLLSAPIIFHVHDSGSAFTLEWSGDYGNNYYPLTPPSHYTPSGIGFSCIPYGASNFVSSTLSHWGAAAPTWGA